MPFTYRIDRSARRISILGSGAPTLDEVIGLVRALDADPAADKTFDTFVDLSSITGVNLTTEDVLRVTSLDEVKRRNETPRRCAVLAPEEHVYGMVRMYENMSGQGGPSSPVDFRVFRDAGKARRWLGLDELEADA